MFEVAAVTYGAVASFVLSSASRNRRERRADPPQVAAIGWLLMSFSATAGLVLAGYAGVQAIG